MPASFSFTRYFILGCVSLLALSSCYYHFGQSDLSERYRTISIPYIEGDDEGELTAELIHTIASEGGLRYLPAGGELVLKIKLIESYDENIGFRYDRHKDGTIKKGLIPTETRLNLTAEVFLLEASSDSILRGPTLIRASIDFDHDYYYDRNSVNVFSLGQLNDIDEAQEAAMRPLHRRLAEKIGDYVLN